MGYLGISGSGSSLWTLLSRQTTCLSWYPLQSCSYPLPDTTEQTDDLPLLIPSAFLFLPPPWHYWADRRPASPDTLCIPVPTPSPTLLSRQTNCLSWYPLQSCSYPLPHTTEQTDELPLLIPSAFLFLPPPRHYWADRRTASPDTLCIPVSPDTLCSPVSPDTLCSPVSPDTLCSPVPTPSPTLLSRQTTSLSWYPLQSCSYPLPDTTEQTDDLPLLIPSAVLFLLIPSAVLFLPPPQHYWADRRPPSPDTLCSPVPTPSPTLLSRQTTCLSWYPLQSCSSWYPLQSCSSPLPDTTEQTDDLPLLIPSAVLYLPAVVHSPVTLWVYYHVAASSQQGFMILLLMQPPCWPSGLRYLPWECKTWASIPACDWIFSRSSHTHDLKLGTPVATLSGAWHYWVSAGTG